MSSCPGLAFVNVELSSRCSKNCWMCGRRKLERDHPDKVNWGHMDLQLAHHIARELPEDITVAMHWNGEPSLNPRFGQILKLFSKQIRVMDTNGKHLIEKFDEYVGNLDTLTISVIENDRPEEVELQWDLVNKFIQKKGNLKPRMVYRLLGKVKDAERWYKLPGIVATRILHNPMGSFDYTHTTTIPEIGICVEALTHLAIDRFGDVFPCVRFNPNKENCFGNIRRDSLAQIWNSRKRKEFIRSHVDGHRNKLPVCDKCTFWGIPRGA